MRWVGFLILLLGLPGNAETPLILRKATLPDASITESTTGNVRRREIEFGSRRLISEQMIDITAPAPMVSDFGEKGSDSADSSPIAQRLTASSWVVDGANHGFYLPRQPEFELTSGKSTAYRLQEVNVTPGVTRHWTRLEFGPTTMNDMAALAGRMENPIGAPLQITEDDDDAMIVYDLATRTTAYMIARSSERMNSEGYLSGSGQPCVVLIRVKDARMTLSAGKTGESSAIRLKLFGDWKPAPGETGLIHCEPKAGRTWVEFLAGPSGTAAVTLEKLPEKSYFQRLLDLIKRK